MGINRKLFCSFMSGVSMLLSLSVLAENKSATVERGFTEPSSFAGMLKPNPKTVTAEDRDSPTLSIIELQSEALEITRYSEKTFTLTLSKQPIFARLQANVWHQGTDEKPQISINGINAETLELFWPSLAQRNYVFFLWDQNGNKTIHYQPDYQGWLLASSFLNCDLLKVGENTVTFAVKLDQIKVKDIKIELLYGFDSDDTIHDFRQESKALPLPMLDKH